jgi:hypothetical protein
MHTCSSNCRRRSSSAQSPCDRSELSAYVTKRFLFTDHKIMPQLPLPTQLSVPSIRTKVSQLSLLSPPVTVIVCPIFPPTCIHTQLPICSISIKCRYQVNSIIFYIICFPLNACLLAECHLSKIVGQILMIYFCKMHWARKHQH